MERAGVTENFLHAKYVKGREKVKIHPLNVKGKYYIDYDQCFCDTACEYSAPNNIKIDTINCSAYFAKQPENQEEEKSCQEAMDCCPVEAILDDGEIKN